MGAYPQGALERVQETEREILKAVAAVCDQLQLTWFLDSGTCLGAVRHQGFIPWDDDIDIGMPLEDYRVFCARAAELLPEGFGIYTHAETPNYPPLWAKVYKKGTRFMGEQMVEAGFEEGLFVDVFAYCQLDENPRRARKQMRRALWWQRMSYLYYSAHPYVPDGVPLRGLVQRACVVAHGVVRALFTPASIERRFEACLYSGTSGQWTDIFYPSWGTFATETLFPVGKALFDGEEYPVPRDVHTYLTTLYGDYRQLPPMEQRGVHPPLILDFGDGVNVMEDGGRSATGS